MSASITTPSVTTHKSHLPLSPSAPSSIAISYGFGWGLKERDCHPPFTARHISAADLFQVSFYLWLHQNVDKIPMER